MYDPHRCRGGPKETRKFSCGQRAFPLPTTAKRKDICVRWQVPGDEFVPSGTRQQGSAMEERLKRLPRFALIMEVCVSRSMESVSSGDPTLQTSECRFVEASLVCRVVPRVMASEAVEARASASALGMIQRT